ncbi:MAG: AI-2E family transporter [Deltaproteobacteria bacterium]|nr:AI-2E family transporter [Deltaproteobacteria bacterium]
MSNSNEALTETTLRHLLTDTLIRFGILIFLVYLCVQVFAPFAGLMMWALIVAVALNPLHLKLTGKLGGKTGLSATVIVLTGLLVIGGPTVMIGQSFASHLHGAYNKFHSGQLTIPTPSKEVAEWPLVGEKVYAVWNDAAENLPAFLESERPQLVAFSKKVLKIAASTAGGVLLFLTSLLIAGIMLAYGESGRNAIGNIFERFAGPVKGPRLHHLSASTVRSVATGVIGVAFIQALLLGLGFIFAGVPGAGVFAIIVLVLGIVQLPATLVTVPVIIYLWMGGDASTTSNVIFTVYLLVAGLADNVLKPLLLGRGVDVPMPIVLFGALGGMVSAGIIGLFIGAILLSVGYQLFVEWVAEQTESPEIEGAASASSE